MPTYHLVMGFGAAVALVGILLFWHRGTEGRNTIKMFGFEFRLAGSALVIFVIGMLTFLAPLIVGDRLQQDQEPPASAGEGQDIQLVTPTAEPQKPESSSPPQGKGHDDSKGHALTVRSLLALRTNCGCDHVQVVVDNIAVARAVSLCDDDDVELEISSVRKPFSESIDLGILVKACNDSPNYWSKDITVTKHDLGTRQVQLTAGGGLYSIWYVVE